MEEKRGYYEISRNSELFGLPVSVLAGNIRCNGLHWHDHIEILLCKKGQTRMRADGVEYVLLPGDFITLSGGISHEIYGGEAGGLQIVASIDPAMLEDMEERELDCSSLNGSASEQEADEIRQLLGQMAVLSNLPQRIDRDILGGRDLTSAEYLDSLRSHHPLQIEENRLIYQSLQYRLLAILSRHKKPGVRRIRKQQNLVSRSVLFIHEHLGEDLSAAVLAEQLHVSEPTVYRLFREQIGMGLGEYVTHVRMGAACRMLQMSSDSVTEIAYTCGFTGLSNFYRVFQKEVGMTPKAYRRQHQQNLVQMMAPEPDIMRLNDFEHFSQLGYPTESLL